MAGGSPRSWDGDFLDGCGAIYEGAKETRQEVCRGMGKEALEQALML